MRSHSTANASYVILSTFWFPATDCYSSPPTRGDDKQGSQNMRKSLRTKEPVAVLGVSRKSTAAESYMEQIRKKISQIISGMEVFDSHAVSEFLSFRQQREVDKYDEVWEGVYVVPPLAQNPHQDLVTSLSVILFNVVQLEGRGRVLAGANISDRKANWVYNYRCPDVVVVLKQGQAIDCGTHWMGGPDFLIEVESPQDQIARKIPFYSKIQVRELLIVHGTTRHLQLYCHDGRQLMAVEPLDFKGSKWLASKVLPLAVRRKLVRKRPLTEIQRIDDVAGNWTV